MSGERSVEENVEGHPTDSSREDKTNVERRSPEIEPFVKTTEMEMTEGPASAKKMSPMATMMISVAMVLAIACAWVSGSQFSKWALQIDKENFFAPFFMMWFNTNYMITCFPIFLIYARIKGMSASEAYKSSRAVLGGTWTKGFVRVFLMLLLWTGANYSYIRGLSFVSPSVATSISSSNACIVYVLALILLNDKFHPFKLISVLLGVAGVVLISIDERVLVDWRGVLLILLCAVFAASYKVIFKKLVGSASLGEVSLFLSCLGALNCIVNAIPMVILALTGEEVLILRKIPILPLLGSGFFSLLYNFLVNFGIALLHPVVISIGMLVGLPLNTAVDILFREMSASVLFLTGSFLLLLSFVLIVFPYEMLAKIQSERSSRQKP